MKLRYIFILSFILLSSTTYLITNHYKNKAISVQLNASINSLETNYNSILHDYEVTSEAIVYSILEFPRVKEILVQIKTASIEKRKILRDELYNLLKKDFAAYKKMGVKLMLFTEPNNKVFLRMHKPEIYSDNVSQVRFGVVSVNKTHKMMKGFEQGKISHAFRHIYPIFDNNNNFLASLDISFSSERLQKTLDDAHKLHSHFLVRKDIINSRIWSVKDVSTPYKHGIEHKNYLMTKRKDENHIDLEASKQIILNNKDIIETNIAKSNKFAIYGNYKDSAMVITFVPVRSIIPAMQAEAYLVSYTLCKNIALLNNEYFILQVSSIIIIFILMLMIYSILEQKEELKKQHRRYHKLMNLASDGIFIMKLDGEIVEVSLTSAKMLGYTEEEMIGLYAYNWDVNFSKEKILKTFQDIPYEPVSFETQHKRKDGSVYDAAITAVKIDIDGTDYIYASIRDITEKKQQTKEITQKLQKFIDTQDSIVVITNGSKLKFANKKFFEFFGYKDLEDFLKIYDCICYKFEIKNGFFDLGKIKKDEATWIDSLVNLNGRDRIISMKSKDKISHIFSVSINTYDNDDYIVSFSDISDTMTEKLKFKKQATVDELTGAYNRIYFNQNIKKIIEKNSEDSFDTWITFFDIDYFKKINDTYGHIIGDQVLKEVVIMINHYIQNDDVLVRWGGEEFIIISASDSAEDVYKSAEHLRYIIEHTKFDDVDKITCSFGCAKHNLDANILHSINRADEALYEAKEGGRNRVVIYK
jgi:diguanylate cyclase (GGDEF)-like protein/PAS domain S-box-containing protein